MSKLYKVTFEQQEAVSRLLDEWPKAEIIAVHEKNPKTWTDPGNECLNGMPLHTLAALVFFPDMVEVEATPIQRAVRRFKTWVPQSSYEVQAALLRAFSEMSFFNIISNQQYGELCRTTFLPTVTQDRLQSDQRMIQLVEVDEGCTALAIHWVKYDPKDGKEIPKDKPFIVTNGKWVKVATYTYTGEGDYDWCQENLILGKVSHYADIPKPYRN